MFHFELTAKQAKTLRSAVERRRIEEDPSSFISEGELPPEGSDEPDYVCAIRDQAGGVRGTELVVSAAILAELLYSLEHHHAGQLDTDLQSVLQPPRVASGMVKNLAEKVAKHASDPERLQLFQFIAADPSKDPAHDDTLLLLGLGTANGTLGALRFIEFAAFRWSDIAIDLQVDAAWYPRGARWVGGGSTT